MTRGRSAALLTGALVVGLTLSGCGSVVEGTSTAALPSDRPADLGELERLLVSEVPSGLPRLPDHEVQPPAGAKRPEDVAGYSTDPARELAVLADYGYRFGWERFWGRGGGPMTGVFVDQFERRAGARKYAGDLAVNKAELVGRALSEDPPDLPANCRELTVAEPVPEAELGEPAAFAWCWHGVFSVAVTAVGPTVDDALAEVSSVMGRQLAQLPPG
ncbi:hypothetical protein [Blastococcus sp. LR1]|uniref:hypothetical protein n=1 Tax=Blastococcus sp. LR1 TaxID=2877000 RepID=UPI001CCC2643|nr:hypothetical protein [Blastococcus sp. LR1]MCA0146509.1 hypothetical protein [Blastococcus sp. LR1]